MATHGNITADGNYPSDDGFIWKGGRGNSGESQGHILAAGTFGSGTATLQYSIDAGTTWVAVGTDTTVDASGGGVFDLPRGVLLRVNMAGSTSPDVDFLIKE